MASINKGKALKKSVNNPISVGESSVSLKNRIEWTVQEENFLVDEFALRRVRPRHGMRLMRQSV